MQSSESHTTAQTSSKMHEFQCSPMMPTPRIIEQQRRKQRKEEEERKRKAKQKSKRTHRKIKSKPSMSSLQSTQSASPLQGATINGSDQHPFPSQISCSIEDDFAANKEPYVISALYGLINVAIVLPVLMSFGTIIYNDKTFEPYLPVLLKLTVLSGTVHQICFSTCSSLPFAVGQVQDAGLIFLSSMAGTIVKYCRNQYPHEEKGLVDEYILATTTIILPLCTTILGIGLVLIGRANLASYVQILPTPVVGGYLAFIGFFCGQSGLALMANVQVGGVLEWNKFLRPVAFMHLLPGLVMGILIFLLVKRIRHMSVLPVCIASLICAFYLVLHLTGYTVQEARENGWVLQSDAPPVWYRTWDYLKFDKVVWGVFPQLIPTLFSMIFVVALSSSLDVAAIELELGRPLDYDHELKTVGLSNIVSGLTGGYTGSYIFSQSIFSLRAGIRRRVNGLIIACCEIIVVMLPVSVLSYVPSFFFGSLLMMIAVDLISEWLWEVRVKMTFAEYGIDLSTFFLTQVLGVEYGILAGLILYATCSKLGMDVGAVEEGEELNELETSELMKDVFQPCIDGGSLATFPSYGGFNADQDGDEEQNESRRYRNGEVTDATLMI